MQINTVKDMKEQIYKICTQLNDGQISATEATEQLLDLFAVSGSLPSADDLKPFLYWVFHKADRIWVEHTLGWRENAIEEMYEAYLRKKQ